MTSNNLGRLERVDLRDIWATEAHDFTPWLAKEENLAELAKTINMDLEFEAQEKTVGPFRADILCKNTDDDSWVLIENQLERTDHIHLGQLLTYAAGLHAVTIAWISAQFTDEHRATLDWLNEITDTNFRFFGLEVQLWRIGESLAAPRFNIVSKPNDWTRSISQATRRLTEGELSETKATYLRYWTALRDRLIANDNPLRPQNPRPQHWYNFGIGKSGYRLGTLASVQGNWIGVELYIRHDPVGACVQQLLVDREAIEATIGAELDWRDLPDKIAARVVLIKQDTNPANEQDWPQQFAWLDQILRGFNTAFRERVRSLDPATDEAKEGQDDLETTE